MKYGTLKQTNPGYRAALWRKLDDLYAGGFDILARAKDYIPVQVGESPERYAERISHAEYVNYLGMVVDSYVANLFAQEPVVAPGAQETTDAFWKDFGANANLKGDSVARVMREVFTTAILKQRAFIACDFPADAHASTIDATSRAEEDAQGKTRGYAFELFPEELVDWAYSDVVTRIVPLTSGGQVEFVYGLLSWAIVRREVCRRDSPDADRNSFVEEFRVWRLDENGHARWELYATPPRKKDDPAPQDDVDFTPIAEGVTTFRQIPIVELCIPPGLWLGNKLGPLALALFRRRSALLASENRSLFPVPVFKHGPEVGGVGEALPPDAQQNPARGYDPLGTAAKLGALGIGHQDDFSFVEPKGTVHTLVDKQLGDAVDEFFRVASMMASSITASTTALGRSGTSKEQDYRSMGVVLEAYAAIVRDALLRVYDLIAAARLEDVDWKVHGIDKYDVVDRALVLEEAKTLAAVSIPSKTFRAHWQTKVALALLGHTSPELQTQIQAEIEAGVTAEEQMQTLMLGAGADAGVGADTNLHGGSANQQDDAGASVRDRRGVGPGGARAPNRAGSSPR